MNILAELEKRLKKAKNEVALIESKIKKLKNKKGPAEVDQKTKAKLIKLLTSGHTATEAAEVVDCNVQQAAAVKAWISRKGISYIKKSS